MTGESTSLPSPETMRAEWNNFFAFLRKPTLPDRQSGGMRSGAFAIWRILVLDLAAMAVLLAIAGIVIAMGVDLPKTALAKIEITAGIIFAVVIVAPVAEELVFRSWLSGRPRYLIAFPIVMIGGLLATMLAENYTGQAAQMAVGLALIGATFLTLILAGLLWKRPLMSWFRATFPVMFWLSTLAFACIHLANFDESNVMTLLPLILPQFILGMLLGYLRVNFGLWTAMALHAIHNGLIISIVVAATAAAT